MRASPLFRYHHTALLLTAPALVAGGVFFLWRVWPQLRLVLWQTFSRSEPTCGCDAIFAFSTHPIFYSLLLVSAVAALAVIGGLVANLVRHIREVRAFVNSLPVVSTEVHVVEGIAVEVQQVNVEESFICTVGFFHPVILMSAAAIAALTPAQRDATLLHELGHIRTFDSVKKIVLFALLDTLFFVPGIQQLKQTVELAQEIRADEYAVARSNRNRVLSALSRMMELRSSSTTAAVPSFALINERVNSLLEEEVAFPFTRALVSVALALALFVVPTALFAQTGSLLDTFSPEYNGGATACIQEYEAVLQSRAQSVSLTPLQCGASEPFDMIIITNYPR